MEISLPEKADLKTLISMKKYLYLPILTILIVVVLIVVVVVPNVRAVVQLRKDNASAKDELLELSEKVEILQAFDESSLQEQIEVLEKVLPSKKAIFEWIYSLNSISAESGATLDSFALNPGSIATESGELTSEKGEKPSTEVEKNKANVDPKSSERSDVSARGKTKRSARTSSESESFKLSINVEGSMDSIVSYLGGVNNLAPLVRITDLNLVPNIRSVDDLETASGELALKIGAKMNLLLFYNPLPEQIPGITEPVREITAGELELYQELLSLKTYEVTETISVPTGRENIFAPL